MPDTSTPTHVAISLDVIKDLLDYLNSKPRGETNSLAVAIENSLTVNIKYNEPAPDEVVSE
jgi:hypothetical protein